MDTERIRRNTSATLSVTFYGDTSPTDADGAVTVTITKPDGTALVTNASTTHPGLGTYRYVLAPQTNLRRLALAWTGNFGGVANTITTYAEIVGGVYFTLYEARNYDSVIAGNTLKYTDEMLKDARLFVESEFERVCGRAFVPRGAYETFTASGGYTILLGKPEVSKIISITVNGEDWTNKSMRLDGTRLLQITDGSVFPIDSYSATNTYVEYEYGQLTVPPDVKTAALKRMRSKVVGQTNRIDERATLMNIPDFGSFSLATPGMGKSHTGIPEVDVVLNEWQWAGGARFG